ncbi:SigB/SigF/SigG family RNA polymerase sigma factor [Longispora sp. NPDC051575]|uniref:SigB/SigF/SigG family RNA polymerase sigma factor n=1 Tax=Longispora sp. NPDC051575 TaxID=3154943 RepID=UPI0034396F89
MSVLTLPTRTARLTGAPTRGLAPVVGLFDGRESLNDTLRAPLARLATMPAGPARDRLRDDVIGAALPLAGKLARRFANRGEHLDDLVQVGRLALIKAVDGFDAATGNDFTSYATPTIVGELKRHFRDKGWTVRVPRSTQEIHLRIKQATGDLTHTLGRTPTVADLAAHLEVGESDIRDGMRCAGAYAPSSLDAPVDAAGTGGGLADLLGDDDPGYDVVEARAVLRPLLERLPLRERRLLTMRFAEELTQSQIAERLNVSQMHVSRLLTQTLTRLRGWMQADESRAMAA